MTVLTYYVNTSGNDTTGDGSSGNPWATIPKFMSSANWAGATGLICDITGDHTLVATLSSVNPEAYRIPWKLQGSGKIIINHTTSTGLVGDWAYRRLSVTCDIELASTVNLFPNGGECDGSTIDCKNNTGYTVFQGDQTIRNATLREAGVSGRFFLQAYSGVRFFNCEFRGCRYIYSSPSFTPPLFERCIFYNATPYFSALGTLGGTTYNAKSYLFKNCIFADTTGSGKTTIEGLSASVSIRDCVFVDSAGTALSGLFNEVSAYYYGMSPGSPTTMGDNSITALAEDPYPNRGSGDWTPSAELAAITGSDGLTPGAVQAAGGGSTLHPLYATGRK